MPVYKNVSTMRKLLNNKVIEPGTEVTSPIYYNENDVQLLKISDEPSHNPVLYSEKIEKECEIVIPKKDSFGNWINKYTTHFYVESGEITIWTNSKKNAPPLLLYPEARWNVRCFERNVDKFIIESGSDFVVFVTVEKCQ